MTVLERVKGYSLLWHRTKGERRDLIESARVSYLTWAGLAAGCGRGGRMSLIHNNAADFEAIRGAIEVSPQRFPGLGPLGLIRCTSLLHPV